MLSCHLAHNAYENDTITIVITASSLLRLSAYDENDDAEAQKDEKETNELTKQDGEVRDLRNIGWTIWDGMALGFV